MEENPKRKLFSKGKGFKSDSKKIGFEGVPNTNIDTYRKRDGRLHRRRKIGKDGYAIKDYDIADGHKEYDHVHDISRENGRNEKDRDPNPKELKEIEKAKRKRRFLK